MQGVKLVRAILGIALLLLAKTVSASALAELQRLDDTKVTDISLFRQNLSAFLATYSALTDDEKSYFNLLQAYDMTLTGDYKTAVTHLENMLVTTENPDILFRSKALLVNVYTLNRNYKSAFSYLEQINRQVKDITDTRAREHGLSVLAYSYGQLEQFDIAKFYAQLLLNETQSDKTRCHAQHHLLEALYGLEQWSEFEAKVDDAISQCLVVEERLFANLIRVKYQQFLVNQQRYDDAIVNFMANKENIEATNYKQLIAGAQILYAEALFNKKRYADAFAEATRTMTLIDGGDSNKVFVLTYSLLYRLYAQQQDFEQAFHFHIKLNDTEKELSDARYVRLQAYYSARAEVEVKDQQITILNKDNELLSLQKNLYEQDVRQKQLIVVILVFSLVIVTILAYRGISGRRRFKRIAEFDQLTGISNRYHFNNQAEVALDYCVKNNQAVAVILFDLDHFKNINDQQGHAAGDWALQAVVKTCRNFMRNNDVFGRIGGEEFAVVLPACQIDKAVLLAEICRDAIASIDSAESGKTFPLSASFGVTGSDISGYQLKQLLADADEAMYTAKARGRNAVAQFGSDAEDI